MLAASLRTLLLVALCGCAQKPAPTPQTLSELAGSLAVEAGRCADTDMVRELERRYAGDPAFDAEFRFRTRIKANAPTPEDCGGVRDYGGALAEAEGRASTDPAPSPLAGLRWNWGLKRLLIYPAGVTAARSTACGLEGLSAKISDRYGDDDVFQDGYRIAQGSRLEGPDSLDCDDVERSARDLVLSLQKQDVARYLPKRPEPILMHCLLPGAQSTFPWFPEQCVKRHGRVYPTFTRVDKAYVPKRQP